MATMYVWQILDKPSGKPSDKPSGKPSDKPSGKPSDKPSGKPSDKPSGKPSDKPSGWRDIDFSDKIEQLYQNYLQNRGDHDIRAFQKDGWQYLIDFSLLTIYYIKGNISLKVRRVIKEN